jgi:hypothetical protein
MEELINRYPNVFSNDVEFIELGELVCNLELKESFVNNANLCKIREFIVDQYNNRKEQLSMKIKKIIEYTFRYEISTEHKFNLIKCIINDCLNLMLKHGKTYGILTDILNICINEKCNKTYYYCDFLHECNNFRILLIRLLEKNFTIYNTVKFEETCEYFHNIYELYDNNINKQLDKN